MLLYTNLLYIEEIAGLYAFPRSPDPGSNWLFSVGSKDRILVKQRTQL